MIADDYSTAFPAASHDDAWRKSLAHDWWPIVVDWPLSAAKKDKGSISPSTSPAREG